MKYHIGPEQDRCNDKCSYPVAPLDNWVNHPEGE
jgi:hypothetical protein